jgi:hypothetical protein
MTLTFLLIGGLVIAMVAVSVVTSRGYAAEAVLVGETTAVGLADPASETLTGNGHNRVQSIGDWQLTTVDSLCDAEDLLDCLEAQGYPERELIVMGNSCFAVRWR